MSRGLQTSIFPIKIPLNPNTLKRMPPTQCILSGRIRSTKLSGRPYVASTRCRSLGRRPKGTQGDPRGPKGAKGTQGVPRGPKGTQGRLRRPWGGWAHGALWGYSEAIPNGKPFRVEGDHERKPIPKVAEESRPKGNGLKWWQNWSFGASGRPWV